MQSVLSHSTTIGLNDMLKRLVHGVSNFLYPTTVKQTSLVRHSNITFTVHLTCVKFNICNITIRFAMQI
jgi:hypothetical protein